SGGRDGGDGLTAGASRTGGPADAHAAAAHVGRRAGVPVAAGEVVVGVQATHVRVADVVGAWVVVVASRRTGGALARNATIVRAGVGVGALRIDGTGGQRADHDRGEEKNERNEDLHPTELVADTTSLRSPTCSRHTSLVPRCPDWLTPCFSIRVT